MLTDAEVEELADILVHKTREPYCDREGAVRAAVADAILVERGIINLAAFREAMGTS